MSAKQRKVGVVGCGSFGTTVAHLLALAGNDVVMFGRDAKILKEITTKQSNKKYLDSARIAPGIRAADSLQALCDECELVFPIVPSKAFRAVMAEMAPFLRAEHMLVHGAKGIESESFKTMSSIIVEETCVRRVGAIAGPNLAREILAGNSAATVVGSRFTEVINAVSRALKSPNFLVYGNRDLIGVELGGALKNILAIGAGIIEGASLGYNAKSLLMTRGLAELTRFGVALGAKAETFSGLSGIGDIIATCSSPLSRNYRVGLALGKGQSLEEIMADIQQVAEGVWTTNVVYSYAQKNKIVMPLTQGLYKLMFEGQDLLSVQLELMNSKISYEIDSQIL